MEPLREILDADITFISLVKAGANQKTIIWKSADHPNKPTLTKTVKILKIDDDKHIVYGIVYSPGEVDTDGDFANDEAIEKIAYKFMKNAKTGNVDQQHDFNSDEGFIAESWITKSGDPLFSDNPTGSWAVGIKIEYDDTWSLVKSGEIQGLSMAGTAVIKPVEKMVNGKWEMGNDKGSGIMKSIIKFFKSKISKDFNSDYAKEQLWALYYALTDSVWKVLDNMGYGTITKDEAKEQIFVQVEQFREKLQTVDLAKEIKPVMNPEILEKIEDLQKALRTFEGINIEKSQEADMETKEVQTMIDKSVKPINDSLEEIKKNLKPVDPNPDDGTSTADTIKKLKKQVEKLEKSLEPTAEEVVKDLKGRIEKLEKATPGSKQATEDETIKKTQKGIQFMPPETE